MVPPVPGISRIEKDLTPVIRVAIIISKGILLTIEENAHIIVMSLRSNRDALLGNTSVPHIVS